MPKTATVAPENSATATADSAQAQPAAQPTDWRATLPEDLRAEKSLESYKDVAALAKAFVETKKLVGKKTDGMVRIPGEAATPEERAAFHKALGVPDTPDGYKFDVAEEFKPLLTDEALNRYRPIFHKLGIPPQTAQQLAQFYAEDQAQQRVATQQALKAEQDKLRESLGEATWDRNLAHAEAGVDYVAAKLGEEKGEQLKALLDSTLLGDHPLLIEAFTLIGRELAESGAVQVEGVAGNMLDTAKEYIVAALQPGHPAMNPDHPEHAAALAKRREYYQLVNLYDPRWRAVPKE